MFLVNMSKLIENSGVFTFTKEIFKEKYKFCILGIKYRSHWNQHSRQLHVQS